MRAVSPEVVTRLAREEDIPSIRDLFVQNYQDDYPYEMFLADEWLKHALYNDDVLTVVAEDGATGRVVGTASVNFSIGSYTDLVGEFGRLVVDDDAKGRGVGAALMEKRLELVRERIHVGIVENRCVHPFSQRISHNFDFHPVGFLPQKHRFRSRESIALFARVFGPAIEMRRSHPTVVPEAHWLAEMALDGCGLRPDCVVDDTSRSYDYSSDYRVKELGPEEYASVLRIERGRVTRREVFGPVRLQYGFFRMAARHASYLVALSREGPQVAGALGFIHDETEQSVRITELILSDERSVRHLLATFLNDFCMERGVAYVEVDTSAHAPRMQRTFLEMGFLPCAYVPAQAFADVERVDALKMAWLAQPIPNDRLHFFPEAAREIADRVTASFAESMCFAGIEDLLARVQLLTGLNPEQSATLARASTTRSIEVGEVVFEAGEAAGALFILLEGEVEVSKAGRVIAHLMAGETFGEVTLIEDRVHSGSVRAVKESRLAVVSREALERIASRRPDIALGIYRNLARGLGRKLDRMNASRREVSPVLPDALD